MRRPISEAPTPTGSISSSFSKKPSTKTESTRWVLIGVVLVISVLVVSNIIGFAFYLRNKVDHSSAALIETRSMKELDVNPPLDLLASTFQKIDESVGEDGFIRRRAKTKKHSVSTFLTNKTPVKQKNSPLYQHHGNIGFNVRTNISNFPYLNTPPENLNMDEVYELFGGYNYFLSGYLPLDRKFLSSMEQQGSACMSLKETLHPNVLETTVSVIIPVRKESLSVLARTIHSLLNHTPTQILIEILVVDDGSHDVRGFVEVAVDHPYLLELPKLSVLKLSADDPDGLGEEAAKYAGLRKAKGKVVVFVNTGVEVSAFWIEPILHALLEDREIIAFPTVELLNPQTLLPVNVTKGCHHGSLWSGISSTPILSRQQPTLVPDSSPVTLLDVVAGEREFFNDIGFDTKMKGPSNPIDISMRSWRCGQGVYCVPCSKVYSIDKQHLSAPDEEKLHRFKIHNAMRTILRNYQDYTTFAWMILQAGLSDSGLMSAIESVQQIPASCESMKWFLDNVYPEASVRLLPEDAPLFGAFLNQGTKLCLEYNSPLAVMKPCSTSWLQQFIYFKRSSTIRPTGSETHCLGLVKGEEAILELFAPCGVASVELEVEFHDTQSIKVDSDSQVTPGTILLSLVHQDNSCIAINKLSKETQGMFEQRECNEADVNQQWTIVAPSFQTS